MKINRTETKAYNSLNKYTCAKNIISHTSLGTKAVKFLSDADSFGEGVNIGMDFVGKAAIAPLLIVLNPFTKKDKENKKFAALKNPIGAILQLAVEAPILYSVSKIVGKAANNGKFDKVGSDFSYNLKTAKDTFIKSAKSLEASCGEEFSRIKPFVDMVEKKGLSRKLLREFDDVIQNLPESVKTNLKNFELTDKRLFHLKNRGAFAAAIVLTPVACFFESKIHTKIANAMENKREMKNVK